MPNRRRRVRRAPAIHRLAGLAALQPVALVCRVAPAYVTSGGPRPS